MKLKINNRYGVTPNEVSNNPNISFKAKGLFTYIQSKPDDWDFSVRSISAHSKESKNAITAGLKELEDAGYLERVKHKNSKGYFEIEYILHDKPITQNPISENTVVRKTDNRNSANPKQVNYIKNVLSKNILSNKENEKKEKTFKKENSLLFPPVPEPLTQDKIREYKKEMLVSEEFIRYITRREGYKCTPEELVKVLNNFCAESFHTSKKDLGFNEFKTHFVRWSKERIKKLGGYITPQGTRMKI